MLHSIVLQSHQKISGLWPPAPLSPTLLPGRSLVASKRRNLQIHSNRVHCNCEGGVHGPLCPVVITEWSETVYQLVHVDAKQECQVKRPLQFTASSYGLTDVNYLPGASFSAFSAPSIFGLLVPRRTDPIQHPSVPVSAKKKKVTKYHQNDQVLHVHL